MKKAMPELALFETENRRFGGHGDQAPPTGIKHQIQPPNWMIPEGRTIVPIKSRPCLIEVIFGAAEYDQPKVYEAGFIPHGLLRGASFQINMVSYTKIFQAVRRKYHG